MGWLFSRNRDHNKKACIEELRRPSRYGDKQRLIKSTVVGNNHWYVAEILATGERYIGLDLMQSGYPDHGWGYKDLCESMGPNEVNCPLGFLDLVPNVPNVPEPNVPEPYGAAWRERVKAYHAQRSAKRRNPPKQGDLVEYGGTTYELFLNLGRKGWSVVISGENPYWSTMRMSSKQLAQARRLDTTPTEETA